MNSSGAIAPPKGGGGRAAGLALVLCGAALGTAFLGLMAWANLEASLFNPAIRGEDTLRSIRSPVLLTRGETGVVKASFYNPGPQATTPTVRASVSFHSVAFERTEARSFTIEPGQRITQSWTVSTDQPAWDRFVFIRLYQHASYPLKSASGFRGIVVVDLPFISGAALTAGVVALSAVCMAFGLRLLGGIGMGGGGRRRAGVSALAAISLLVTAGMAASLLGAWILAAGALVLVLILASVAGLASLAEGRGDGAA